MQIVFPEKLFFSLYSYKTIPILLKERGLSPLVVVGCQSFQNNFWGREIIRSFNDNGLEFFLFDGISPEPDICFVEKGLKLAKDNNCNAVLGIGGGSVLDVAKAIAGLFYEQCQTVSEYLKGKPIKSRGIDFIAVPTTSGSGSEVSSAAVLKDKDSGIKTAIRDSRLTAKIVLIDPVLTETLPAQQTLYSALDALTHALEACVSKEGSCYSDMLSQESFGLITEALPACLEDLRNLQYREKLSYGSLFAGLSFACAGLGLSHALSHPVGMIYGLAHGLVNAVIIPYVVEFNYPENRIKYDKLLKASSLRCGNDFRIFLRGWLKALGVPGNFSDLGLTIDGKVKRYIIDNTLGSGVLKYNPRDVDGADIEGILDKLWQS